VTLDECRCLRELARRVRDGAELPIQRERVRLWKALNTLHPERPMVLLNPQNGWDDLLPAATLRCADPLLRETELGLRKKVHRLASIPDDQPITADFAVSWVIVSSGFGLAETQVRTEARGAFGWDPPIKSRSDSVGLHPAQMAVDRGASRQRLAFFEELFGDLLRVGLHGVAACRCGLTRKLIMLRGLNAFLLDLYDAPDFVRELMSFLRDEQLREYDFYEREGLLGLNNGPDVLTGSGGVAATDDLPAPGFDPDRVRTMDMMCWGEAQETSGVGPEQFAEFVLSFQRPVLNRFGLVDYGCCEPLDSKWDLITGTIPRLRWAAVSPWADRALAAEKLRDRFVYCYKPQPALVCREKPDWSAAEGELRETTRIARGCCLSMVLKDTTSFFGDPTRATRWAEMATRVAFEAAS
jgi:hypothetical protein